MYTASDYYLVDELLSEEYRLIRKSVLDWVDRRVLPVIDGYAQRHEFPKHLIKEMGSIGAFGPYIPEKYGGAGLDQMAYDLIMT